LVLDASGSLFYVASYDMLIAFVLLFWMPKAALAVFVAFGVFSIIAKLAGWLEKP